MQQIFYEHTAPSFHTMNTLITYPEHWNQNRISNHTHKEEERRKKKMIESKATPLAMRREARFFFVG
jgi:hypothetical protein